MTVVSVQLHSIYIVNCVKLDGPKNGTLTCSWGDGELPSYEDTCSFTCITGYVLTGSDTRTCQNDGSWSGDETICTGKAVCRPYLFNMCIKMQPTHFLRDQRDSLLTLHHQQQLWPLHM